MKSLRFVLALSLVFTLSACEKKPKAIFQPDQMYWILMVSHSMHSYTPCQPLRDQQTILGEVNKVRGKKDSKLKILEETAHYLKIGETETSARHYFANQEACQNFTQDLKDIGFKKK